MQRGVPLRFAATARTAFPASAREPSVVASLCVAPDQLPCGDPTACADASMLLLSRSRGAVPIARYGTLFLLAVSNAHAQFRPADVPLPLDPVVVTASRSPQRLLDLVADVTVLDAEQIANGGLQGVVALLA